MNENVNYWANAYKASGFQTHFKKVLLKKKKKKKDLLQLNKLKDKLTVLKKKKKPIY